MEGLDPTCILIVYISTKCYRYDVDTIDSWGYILKLTIILRKFCFLFNLFPATRTTNWALVFFRGFVELLLISAWHFSFSELFSNFSIIYHYYVFLSIQITCFRWISPWLILILKVVPTKTCKGVSSIIQALDEIKFGDKGYSFHIRLGDFEDSILLQFWFIISNIIIDWDIR